MTQEPHTDPHAAQKRAAAEAAVALVQDGMAVGLGTGSTAAFAVAALGARVRQGLRVVGLPTSERTAAQALAEGISLITFTERPRLDLTIDGADQIARGTLDLVKGMGGALLREKIVAAASERLVIVADESKLAEVLGGPVRVPVEVVAFGWESTASRIRELGLDPLIRRMPSGEVFRTDGGNVIVDCDCGPISEPERLHREIKSLVGVVETGFFVGMTSVALVAGEKGVLEIKPSE